MKRAKGFDLQIGISRQTAPRSLHLARSSKERERAILSCDSGVQLMRWWVRGCAACEQRLLGRCERRAGGWW